MRAIVTQVCHVCGRRTKSKSEMAEHTEEKHGKQWAPAQMTRSEDQMEFKGVATTSRWGRELR